jgi:outer membrane protein
MKKKLLLIIPALFQLFCPGPAYAVDLVDVYQQAVISDPIFQAAEATYLATKENIPINRAYLLPELHLAGNALQNHQINHSQPPIPLSLMSLPHNTSESTFDYHTTSYTVSLQQALFNYQAWATLAAAKTSVKAAYATYIAAAQDLISRVTTAYLGALLAQDNLRFVLAEKAAIYQQLDQVRTQFEVGLVAITGVYQAQAQYDSILAEEISARNDIVNATENLRTLTNVYYEDLNGIKDQLPLINPDPDRVEDWVKTSERQNWTLQASRLAAQLAQEQITIQKAGHLPVLSAVGQYQGDRSGTSPAGTLNTRTASAGIQLVLPLYQGGLVIAETRQAQHLYEQALANLEQTRRTVVNNTHQSFNNIVAGISKVNADRQTIVSSESSLVSTTEAYQVGTETMLDVLKAQQDLFNAELLNAADQYNYLNAIIALKQAAGILVLSDIQQINSWLTKSEQSSSAIRAKEMIERIKRLNRRNDIASTTLKKPTG